MHKLFIQIQLHGCFSSELNCVISTMSVLKSFAFFLFCIRFTGLDELAEFNWDQSTMSVG